MIENVQIACLIPRPLEKKFTSEKFQGFHVRQLPNDAKCLLVAGYDSSKCPNCTEGQIGPWQVTIKVYVTFIEKT